jgi:hypothetical protein
VLAQRPVTKGGNTIRKDLTFCEMSISHPLENNGMNTTSTTKGPNSNTSDVQLRAIPQFDGVRWKLRLERVPTSTDKEYFGPVISRIAVGMTILSPVICLLAAYLWAVIAI